MFIDSDFLFVISYLFSNKYFLNKNLRCTLLNSNRLFYNYNLSLSKNFY